MIEKQNTFCVFPPAGKREETIAPGRFQANKFILLNGLKWSKTMIFEWQILSEVGWMNYVTKWPMPNGTSCYDFCWVLIVILNWLVVCVFICLYEWVSICMVLCKCMCMFLSVCMSVCVSVCLCFCVAMYMNVRVCVFSIYLKPPLHYQ